MRPISAPVKVQVLSRPDICQRRAVFHDHECQGRLTLEHCFVYANRQIDEAWAIIKLCAWAHDVDQFQGGGNLNKEKNQAVALLQATPEDEEKYPRAGWEQKRRYLSAKLSIKL